MRFPIIRVRDKATSCIHVVGTDHHDRLVLDEKGSIQYLNMQCMCGTPETYEFVEHNEFEDCDALFGADACEWVTLDEAGELEEKDKSEKERSYEMIRKMFGPDVRFIS